MSQRPSLEGHPDILPEDPNDARAKAPAIRVTLPVAASLFWRTPEFPKNTLRSSFRAEDRDANALALELRLRKITFSLVETNPDLFEVCIMGEDNLRKLIEGGVLFPDYRRYIGTDFSA